MQDIDSSMDLFENLYIGSRRKEQRIYTDDELILLPYVKADHPHRKEWQVRKRSAERLKNYLAGKKSSLQVLEVGCGNGWLSAYLSPVPAIKITGIDINGYEIKQAANVFSKIGNLDFKKIRITDIKPEPGLFDIIVFAASFQYFKSADEIISKCFSLLNANGEIHILDSIFYSEYSVRNAKKRSEAYYESIGYSPMKEFYFHHSYEELKGFKYELLSDPRLFINKLKGNDVFPWIKITR